MIDSSASEAHHEKTCILNMQKQRPISAVQYNSAADQRLYFHCIDSTIPLLFKSEAIYCGCTDWFVSDIRMLRNPKNRFSRDWAQIKPMESLDTLH